MYANLADWTLRISLDDLAERAAPDDLLVSGETLHKGIAGETLEAEVQAAVSAAIAKLNQYLADASAEIDGYLLGRYPALDDPPALLTAHAVYIATYHLFGGDKDSQTYNDYKVTLAYLARVASGKIALISTDDASSQADVQIAAEDAVFTRDTLSGYGNI